MTDHQEEKAVSLEIKKQEVTNQVLNDLTNYEIEVLLKDIKRTDIWTNTRTKPSWKEYFQTRKNTTSYKTWLFGLVGIRLGFYVISKIASTPRRRSKTKQ